MGNRLNPHDLIVAIILSVTIAACNAPSNEVASKLNTQDCVKDTVDAEGKTAVPCLSGDLELDGYLYEFVESINGKPGYSLLYAYEYLASDSFAYVPMDYVDIASPGSEWSVRCALEMAESHEGNCYRYAGLMCWFARALGYDAEVVSGASLFSRGWGPHAWVEVYLNGDTYIIDAQQHACSWNEGKDFFMVTYDEAPIYYSTIIPPEQSITVAWSEAW